jgi:hypothetical protein
MISFISYDGRGEECENWIALIKIMEDSKINEVKIVYVDDLFVNRLHIKGQIIKVIEEGL